MVVCACHPSAGEADTRKFNDQKPGLLGEVQGTERSHLKNKVGAREVAQRMKVLADKLDGSEFDPILGMHMVKKIKKSSL